MMIRRFLSQASFAGVALSCGMGMISASAIAQSATQVPLSQADLARSSAATALTTSLSLLVKNPHDVAALIGAGEASLELADGNAALGFFGRADDLSPNNGRVKAGLGRSMLQLERNADALRLMQQATALGYSDRYLLCDRGLARDLTGDQAGAQRDYQTALRLKPGDTETVRRYAISLGISGQMVQAVTMLQPLLSNSDRAAWRDRAFILAMNGKTDEALGITRQVMPPQLATAIQPYMERMHMLGVVQKAEAVHLGKFPPGLVKLGIAPVRPPVAVAAAAPAAPASTRPTRVQRPVEVAVARPVPAVPPVASSPPAWASRQVQGPPAPGAPVPFPSPAQTRAPVAPPAPTPVPVPAPVPVASRAAPPAAPSGPPVPPPIDYGRPSAPMENATVIAPAPVAPAAAAPAPVTPVTPAAVAPAPAPAPLAQVQAPAPVSEPPPATPVGPAISTRTLAQIMAEVKVPEAEQAPSVAPVNLAEIAALQAERRKARLAAEAKAKKDADLKAKKDAEAKAKAEALAEKKRLAASPARIWVQVATGRSTSALAFDLKRLRKKYPDEMGSKDGATAPWGSTNRLVVGPFSSSAKAKDYAAALKKAGSDAFIWNSDAGEEVTPLGGK